MSIIPRVQLLLCATLLLATAMPAQQTASAPPASPHADTSEIMLDVVATPKSGPPSAELRREDFTILDNKVPQPITAFKAMGGTDAPVHVLLLIDAVNTGYENIAYERSEIDKYLKANGGHLAYPTALAVFTDTSTQIQQGYSTDGNGLSKDLDTFTIGLRDIRRSAGFYGAAERFDLSIRALDQLAAREASVPGRKLVLWISPGWPLLSGPGVQLDAKEQRQLFANIVGISHALRQSRITLYSLDSYGANESLARADYYQSFVKGVSKPSQVDIGDLSLQALAVQSGGLALNTTGVQKMIQQCVADAGAYYELAYRPLATEAPTDYHHIEVKLTQSGLTPRTRQGYYTQP